MDIDYETLSGMTYGEAMDIVVGDLEGDAKAIDKMAHGYEMYLSDGQDIINDLLALLSRPCELDDKKAALIYQQAKEMADAFIQYMAARHVCNKMDFPDPELKEFYDKRKTHAMCVIRRIFQTQS